MDVIDLLIRSIKVGCKYIHVNLEKPNYYINNKSNKIDKIREKTNIINSMIINYNLLMKKYINNVFKENINNYELFKLSNDSLEINIIDEQIKIEPVNNNNFNSLNSKYDNFIKKTLDLSQIINNYGSHHRFGWNAVRDKIDNSFIHNPNGILIDLFCERTFIWNNFKEINYYHKKNWIGFIHSTSHKYKTFNNGGFNLKNLLKNYYFIKSLKKCVGLICLSLNNKIILENFLKEQNLKIKLYTILHPCEISEEKFKYNSLNKRLNHVGWYMRDFSAFSQLKYDNKRIIIPNTPCEFNFKQNYIISSCNENNVIFDNSINISHSLTPEEYDNLLKTELIFNKIIEPSGSNLISECVSCCNPIILNRDKTFEEQLGKDYPMFYNNIEEVNSLITEENINKAILYLFNIRNRFTYDNFINNFIDIIKRCINENNINIEMLNN